MMNDYSKLLPPMLFGDEIKQKMTCLPEYREEYRKSEPGQRLLRLADLYKIFVVNQMAEEVYSKLYMMNVLSLNQKGKKESIQRLNIIRKNSVEMEYKGVISGASCTTILGTSGVGKSSCIQRTMELMGPVIEIKDAYHKIVPIVLVTCPFDCNYKGLLWQILLSLDEALGTDYYEKTRSRSYNAQGLLAMVCQLCHLHVGVLVIDEIQFLMQHKSGTMLFRMILQLLNSSGIGIVLVGTDECIDYLQQAPQMARRTTGLRYRNLRYGAEFNSLVETLFRYQYTSHRSELSEGLLSWLYEHTAGNPANTMELIHDAQEIAILKGREKLDIASFTEAYSNRMQMLHPYIESEKIKPPKTSTRQKNMNKEPFLDNMNCSSVDVGIIELFRRHKNGNRDMAEVFRTLFIVEEVAI